MLCTRNNNLIQNWSYSNVDSTQMLWILTLSKNMSIPSRQASFNVECLIQRLYVVVGSVKPKLFQVLHFCITSSKTWEGGGWRRRRKKRGWRGGGGGGGGEWEEE